MKTSELTTEEVEGIVYITIPEDQKSRVVLVVGDDSYKLNEVLNVFDFGDYSDG